MTVQQVYQIERVLTPEAFEEALEIRFDVFVKEQGVSPDVEMDADDKTATHWLVKDAGNEPVATARLTRHGNGVGKIGRVAVVETHRGQGIGKILLERMEQDARQDGYKTLMLHGQVQCQGFYEKLGYTVSDPDVFDEDGIAHIKMEKAL